MQSSIARATKQLQRSAQLLEYRRLNWRVETKHRIRSEFEAFVREARTAGFPFELCVQQHITPNEEVVQIYVQRTLTGIVDRKHVVPWDNLQYADTPVFESGGELVASQSATGFVHFIVHPRKSDRITPNKNDLIIYRSFDPTEVTVQVIRRALKRYLLILQDSSMIGTEDALSFNERLAVIWLNFRELRSRHELYRSLLSLRNEWFKAIVAGIFAFVVGYITGSKT
jgi:hypothetical protein